MNVASSNISANERFPWLLVRFWGEGLAPLVSPLVSSSRERREGKGLAVVAASAAPPHHHNSDFS